MQLRFYLFFIPRPRLSLYQVKIKIPYTQSDTSNARLVPIQKWARR